MSGKNLRKFNSANERRAKTLASKLDRHLVAYATAASAACVGLLALAQPSQAEIVYTPANIPVPINVGFVPLDLNNDGITDFNFLNQYFLEAGTFGRDLEVRTAHPLNRIWAIESKGYPCAVALRSGEKIGKKNPFQIHSSRLTMAFSSGSGDTWTQNTFGPWLGNREAYLGLKFAINGEVHYGWAEVQVQNFRKNGSDEVTILGYAYETVPNKPIESGKTSGTDETSTHSQEQPATLGALALGWSGLDTWRRQSESVNPQ